MIREVFGAWDELPDAWREVFTTNGPALLAELRGGEHTDVNRLSELQVPARVLTAETSPDEIRSGSEAVGRAIPHARSVHVGGGHAIDPDGPDVLAFISELLERSIV